MANTYKIRQLSEVSWLFLEDGERTGLVIQRPSDVIVIGGEFNGIYQNLADLRTKIGKTLAEEEITTAITDKEEGEIEGFPIRHGSWHNVMTSPIPSYTRSEKSQNRYAAGYYALRFPHGWTQSFCPKLATLVEYEYMGPFKTKLEMSHQISTKNKSINV